MRLLIATVAALALLASAASAADRQILLVHGYASEGTDCNGGTWRQALRYFQDAGGRERSSLTTVGYYAGDTNCDVTVGDGKASNERPIQDIARDLANYVDSKGMPVDLIGHSMGGLIVRVALLGSAQGWQGFPAKLDVDNVVTLSTPHQGVSNPSAHDDEQWRQMRAGSGFLKRLHEKGSGLDDDWAQGTDWSLVGSQEDDTVSHASGIDNGNHADQKYGYHDDAGDSGNVTHSGVRTLSGANRYRLSYTHAAGDHPPHSTTNGWSPLKTAFQAATTAGDGLPN